jgi:hypothetical protein
MSRSSFKFTLVLVAAAVIAAVGSHWVASWLKIKTTASQAFTVGQSDRNPPAFLAASSVGGYAISWDMIATQLDIEIKTWGVAGGSPVEFEQFQKRVPAARTTFIVVSSSDLDEALICDFRADIVPISRTIETLRATHADWEYSKRALNQYPMKWLRILFPTLGRSRDIMGATLIKVKNLIKHSTHTTETPTGPTIKFGKATADDQYARDKVSDWSEAKIIGKLVATQVGFQGAHSFDGPKRLAFERMLQYAVERGRTIVVVLPVSSAYSKEFMHPDAVQKFEASLADARRHAPQSEWVRLDQLPGLASNENYCDLVHMNMAGKQLATEALQTWLKQSVHQP